MGAEHSYIPINGNTPCPARGHLTRDFARTLDPFVALTAGAEEIGISAFGLPPDADTTAQFRNAGVERVIFAINPGDQDEMLLRLDRCAALAQRE